ncbi:MAG: hypothetical protein WCZ72_08160 [Gemmobacter sp.]
MRAGYVLALALVLGWTPLPSSAQGQTWNYSNKADPFTDVLEHGISISNRRTVLMFLCREGEPLRAALIWAGVRLGARGDIVEVEWRAGRAPSVKSDWKIPFTGGVVEFDRGREVVATILSEEATSSVFVARSGGYFMEFDTSGLAQALEEITPYCT